MSDNHSGGDDSVGHEADIVDTTEDMEVELCLPLEVDMEQDQPHEDIRTSSGAAAPSEVEQHRFEPPERARPKWPRHGLPLPIILEPRSPVTGAMTNLGGPGVGLRRLGVTAQLTRNLSSVDGMPGLRHPRG